MTMQTINVGAAANDGTGDPLRTAWQKVNANFGEVYGAVAALGSAASKNVGIAAGNVPLLDGSGLLDPSILPALAISDIFTVASQAAMLALTAQRGDIAIRTDLNKSFALSTNSPSTLADWKELLTPTDAVLSVAGLTGAITAAALKATLYTAPTRTEYLSGSGTYTPPVGVKWLRVRLVGGGGGGSGSGTSPGAGGNGGATTFGASFLTASNGSGASGTGGAGGTATGGDSNFTGINGAGAYGGSSYNPGPPGGNAQLLAGANNASPGAANTGAGGAGADMNASFTGYGGGGGGSMEKIIGSPAASYAYAVGAGGAGGTAGSGGQAGKAGAAGRIIIEEFYA